jgi:hypothetical protein
MTSCHGWPCRYKSSKAMALKFISRSCSNIQLQFKTFFALVFQLHIAIQIELDFYWFSICGTRPITNVILLPKLFWPTVRKNCLSDREKLLKFEAQGWEFSKILVTKCVLTCSLRFLISNKLEKRMLLQRKSFNPLSARK